jgi:hypothetical protein
VSRNVCPVVGAREPAFWGTINERAVCHQNVHREGVNRENQDGLPLDDWFQGVSVVVGEE